MIISILFEKKTWLMLMNDDSFFLNLRDFVLIVEYIERENKPTQDWENHYST